MLKLILKIAKKFYKIMNNYKIEDIDKFIYQFLKNKSYNLEKVDKFIKNNNKQKKNKV